MSLEPKTVARIAHLARIRLDEAAAAPMAEELSHILDWVEVLNELPTDGVEPMTSAVVHSLRQRVDQVTDGNLQGQVLANAPQSAAGFYAVPKVVE